MSEFACREGHLMLSTEIRCQICGGRVATMDGKTNRQLEAEEKDWDHRMDALREREEQEKEIKGGEEECE